MKLFNFGLYLILATLAFSHSAHGSEIGSGSKAKKSHDLHETYTRLAEFCVVRSSGRPQNCSDLFPLTEAYTETAITTKRGMLAHAVRWPDDPTRKLDSDPSKLNFGLQMFDKCNRSLNWGTGINNVGLLCSSHFGKLQFLHAQATGEDSGPIDTQKKIISWARFTFRVATDPKVGDMDYCQFVGNLGKNDHGLKDALTFSQDTFCKTHGRRNNIPAWKVKTFFSLQCKNPISSKNCIDLSVVQDPTLAKRAAMGALLHLVQDSYSQSHAARVADGNGVPSAKGPFQALIVCRPISLFYDYRDQNDTHADADVVPRIHTSCYEDGRAVDDLLTASANVLWFVQSATDENREQKLEDFIGYLESRVFLMKT